MRTKLPLILAGFLVVFGFIGHDRIESQANGAEIANLRQQLVSGLRVARKDDLAFIDKVVTMVSEDELPLKLVMATYQWTRENPKAQTYPFYYFQRALREQAKKLKIDV